MLDIERKSYLLVEENLDALDKVLFDIDYINEFVFQNVEQIEYTRSESLEQFIRICVRLLKQGNLFDVFLIINSVPSKHDDSNVALFYALIERLGSFLKKVLDLMILDQFLSILLNWNLDDVTYDIVSKPFKTGSYYEQCNFGLEYFQEGLDKEMAINLFDQELYYVKSAYKLRIEELLRDPKYRFKYTNFIEILRQMMAEHFETPYIDCFYAAIFSLIDVPKYPTSRIRVTKESSNQYSLFRN